MNKSDTSNRPSLIKSILIPVIALAVLSILQIRFDQAVETDLFSSESWQVTWLGKGLIAGFILITTLLLFRLTTSLFIGIIIVRAMHKTVPKIVDDVIGIVFTFLSILICIGVFFGQFFSEILAFSGVIGIIIGLALRPIILDIFSGLSTNIETAFRIGDWITIEGGNFGYTGWVDQINWRTTNIRTRDGNLIVCPNSILSTSVVTNHARPSPLSRYTVQFKLPPEVDSKRAIRILHNAIRSTYDKAHGASKDGVNEVLITKVENSGIEYLLRFWINPSITSFDASIHLVNQEALRHLRSAGIPLATERKEIFHSGPLADSIDYDVLEDRVTTLGNIELFDGLDRKHLEELARNLQIRTFKPKESYFRLGDISKAMYVLIEGCLTVSYEKNGNLVSLGTLEPGDYFGEMALLTHEPRSATVVSETESTAFEISPDLMAELLHQDPDIMVTLSNNLAMRKDENKRRLSQLSDVPHETSESLAQTILTKMKSAMKLTRELSNPEKHF